MRALRVHENGGLNVEDVGRPAQPEGNDVLIRVKATAIAKGELEWPETKQREVFIPGHDVAGIIEAVGDAVTGFEPGDEVFALTSLSLDGAAAEYQLVPSSDLAIKPPSLTFAEAASIPLSALTAYQALFTHAETRPGQRVLINGATTGVGVMAVQIAAVEQLLVTAVCSGSEEEASLAKTLGAHEVLDMGSGSIFADHDIVLDTVGDDSLPGCFALLKGNGQMICTARPATVDEKMQRPDVETIFFRVEPDGEELTNIAQYVEQEILRPVVHAVLPLEEGEKAFSMLDAGGVKGKVVLSLEAEGVRRVDSPREATL